MKNKHCSWCDNAFQTKISYQIYCSATCREVATREKIAEKYLVTKTEKRRTKTRLCKSCGKKLSVYNDEAICQKCEVNPDELTKALKELKGIADGKIELE